MMRTVESALPSAPATAGDDGIGDRKLRPGGGGGGRRDMSRPQTSPAAAEGEPHAEHHDPLMMAALATAKLRRGLQEMLQPKVLDVMQKDYVTVEPKFIRSSAAANLLKRGYRMYNAGNYEGTITTLTQAIERDSKDVMSYFWRGVAEARLGQYLKSVKDFDAALALQTAASAEHEASLLASHASTRKRSSQSNAEHLLAPILFNRALSSMNVGDDEAALRDLNELIRLDSHNADYLRQRAIISRRGDQWKRAHNDYMVMRNDEMRARMLKEAQERAQERAEKEKMRETGKSVDLSVDTPPEDDPELAAAAAVAAGAAAPHGSTTTTRVRGDVSLAEYRNLIGAPQDIYSGIFIKPTDVQRALAMAPELRDQRAITTIAETIKNIHIFRGLTVAERNRLATVIEYRLLEPRDNAFCQGEHSGCMCVVLSGAVSMRMRSEDAAALSEAVGTIRSGEHFGHGALMSTTDDVGPNNKKAADDHANQVHTMKAAGAGGEKGEKDNFEVEFASAVVAELAEKEKDRMRRQERDSMLLETYQAECATELMVVPKDTFDALLRKYVYRDLRWRYTVLRRSGVFDAWAHADVVRLARFTRMRVRGLSAAARARSVDAT